MLTQYQYKTYFQFLKGGHPHPRSSNIHLSYFTPTIVTFESTFVSFSVAFFRTFQREGPVASALKHITAASGHHG